MEDRGEEGAGSGSGAAEWVPYVSGAAVRGLAGRRVRVWGRVESAAAGGADELRLAAADGTALLLRLRNGPSDQASGWLEAVGLAQPGGILVDHLLPFAPHTCQQIDVAAHHSLTQLLTAFDDPWNLGEDAN